MSLLRRVPWYGKLLLGVSVLFLLVSIGFYGAALGGGKTVKGSSSPNAREQYRWTGGQVQLEATERQEPTTCYIGNQRAVHLAGTKRSGTHQVTLSYSAPATITCTRDVTAYTGSAIDRRDFSRSAAFRGAAVALIVVPLAFWGVIRVLRRAARG